MREVVTVGVQMATAATGRTPWKLAALATALCAQATPVRAYRTAADLKEFPDDSVVAWDTAEIAIELADTPSAPERTEVYEAVLEGIMPWASLQCTQPTISLEDAAGAGAAPDDGRNTLEWVDDWSDRSFDPALPAVTDVQYAGTDGTWHIVEADTYFNAQHFRWTSRPSDNPDVIDIVPTVTHELGHTLGLLHPCSLGDEADAEAPACDTEAAFEESVLHPAYVPTRSIPSDDDEAGLCALYRQQEPCAAGEACADAGAGNEPPREPCEGADAGVCTDAERSFGNTCTGSDSCASGLCLERSEADDVCTRQCESEANPCPFGWVCTTVDDDSVCTPDSDGGCMAAPHLPASPTGLAPVFLSLAALIRRRSTTR